MNIISEHVLRIDMDEIATLLDGYSPQKAKDFRLDASAILTKVLEQAIKQKISFVLDGTFSHGNAISNVARTCAKGYTVIVVVIHQDPLLSWQFTKDRELVEKRCIELDDFILSYERMWRNISSLLIMDLPVRIQLLEKRSVSDPGTIRELKPSDIPSVDPISLRSVILSL